MKRKELLRNLMAPPPEGDATGGDRDKAPSPAPPARPRATKGAVSAVGRSIADLKARAVVEIDPFEIEAGGIRDRLEHDDAVSISGLSDARSSDERFEAVLDWLKSRQARDGRAEAARAPTRTREVLRAHDGKRLAELGRSRGSVTMKMKSKDLDGFDEWLAENLAEIHRDWLDRRGG